MSILHLCSGCRALLPAVLALGMIGNRSFYDGFVPNYADHHGLLTASVMGIVLGAIFMGVYLPLSRIEVDASTLALIVGLIYLSVLAVTIPPALRAARLPAVEALRLED